MDELKKKEKDTKIEELTKDKKSNAKLKCAKFEKNLNENKK